MRSVGAEDVRRKYEKVEDKLADCKFYSNNYMYLNAQIRCIAIVTIFRILFQ